MRRNNIPDLKDLTIYLNTLKICNLIHQKIFNEEHSIEISSMLSESIVKWRKDMLHKDHWDITNPKGQKIREVDFYGNEIWPDGPKNKNKRP